MAMDDCQPSENAGGALAWRRLEEHLLQTPGEDIRERTFKLAIDLKEAGCSQSEVAAALHAAAAVWNYLASQWEEARPSEEGCPPIEARLAAIHDATGVVCGFDGAPSPLFGTTLPRPKQEVRWTEKLRMPRARAAEAVKLETAINDHDSAIVKLQKKEQEIQRELEALMQLEEEDAAEEAEHATTDPDPDVPADG